MSEKDNGGPAFSEVPGSNNEYEGKSGMTLRDYFAAKMMPLQLAQEMKPYKDYNYSNAATRAYAMADAMLEARKK